MHINKVIIQSLLSKIHFNYIIKKIDFQPHLCYN